MYEPERLKDRHKVSSFDCGHTGLDSWLQDSALASQAEGASVTEVLSNHGTVVAYYTVSPTAVDVIPGYLLGKLAVEAILQGNGLGERLLVHALKRVARAAGQSGGRLVVVDAIDDRASEFYQHFGFTPVPETSRLFMKMSTVRRFVDGAG